MKEYLVISALGEDRPGIVEALSKKLLEKGLNIEDSRMSVLGGEFAVMLLLSGDAHALNTLESELANLESQLKLTLNAKRTQPKQRLTGKRPYRVEVISMDHPGIVQDLARFFSAQDINIEDLSTHSYAAPHTGTPMFSVHMTLGIPANTNISKLRNNFLTHCDALNLDAHFEACR